MIFVFLLTVLLSPSKLKFRPHASISQRNEISSTQCSIIENEYVGLRITPSIVLPTSRLTIRRRRKRKKWFLTWLLRLLLLFLNSIHATVCVLTSTRLGPATLLFPLGKHFLQVTVFFYQRYNSQVYSYTALIPV